MSLDELATLCCTQLQHYVQLIHHAKWQHAWFMSKREMLARGDAIIIGADFAENHTLC